MRPGQLPSFPFLVPSCTCSRRLPPRSCRATSLCALKCAGSKSASGTKCASPTRSRRSSASAGATGFRLPAPRPHLPAPPLPRHPAPLHRLQALRLLRLPAPPLPPRPAPLLRLPALHLRRHPPPGKSTACLLAGLLFHLLWLGWPCWEGKATPLQDPSPFPGSILPPPCGQPIQCLPHAVVSLAVTAAR